VGIFLSRRQRSPQQAFFDHFLKGIPTEVSEWPKVRVEVREKYYVGEMRAEKEWRFRNAVHETDLDCGNASLQRNAPSAESSRSYATAAAPGEVARAQFDFKFDQRCDLIGNMKLKLWMSLRVLMTWTYSWPFRN